MPQSIFPTFRYRDLPNMIAWLGDAFGFSEHVIHRQAGDILHAELKLGGDIVMLGPVRANAFGGIVGAPGHGNGSALYIAVEEVDGLHARAKAAGAKIEEELTERDYGSREFICRDPEGYVWCFGTYRP